jgi:protein tyrosine/serine phosphatase
MRLIRRISPTFVALLTLVLALSVVSFAQEQNKENSFSEIKIKNFGALDERFHRGARPKEEDLKALAAMGIKTVIDLTDNSREYEQPAAEAAGLRYINIPMKDKSYPDLAQINEFLKVANDPETGKFFVHCAGGRHRTGVVGAVYRFNKDGWNLEQVIDEMYKFDFGSGFGHGKQKDFVKNYWKELQSKQVNAAATTVVDK